MSGAKHTRGPWEADSADISISEERDVYPASRRGKRPNGGYIIARLPGPDREANARLCAAALEMLAALQAAELCIGELSPTQARVETMQAIQAAITKATGTQHDQ